MSGGSWDYFFTELEAVSRKLQDEECPYRQALGEYLYRGVPALKSIEWVDSGDSSTPEDIEAIKRTLSEDALAYCVQDLKDRVDFQEFKKQEKDYEK